MKRRVGDYYTEIIPNRQSIKTVCLTDTTKSNDFDSHFFASVSSLSIGIFTHGDMIFDEETRIFEIRTSPININKFTGGVPGSCAYLAPAQEHSLVSQMIQSCKNKRSGIRNPNPKYFDVMTFLDNITKGRIGAVFCESLESDSLSQSDMEEIESDSTLNYKSTLQDYLKDNPKKTGIIHDFDFDKMGRSFFITPGGQYFEKILTTESKKASTIYLLDDSPLGMAGSNLLSSPQFYDYLSRSKEVKKNKTTEVIPIEKAGIESSKEVPIISSLYLSDIIEFAASVGIRQINIVDLSCSTVRSKNNRRFSDKMINDISEQIISMGNESNIMYGGKRNKRNLKKKKTKRKKRKNKQKTKRNMKKYKNSSSV